MKKIDDLITLDNLIQGNLGNVLHKTLEDIDKEIEKVNANIEEHNKKGRNLRNTLRKLKRDKSKVNNAISNFGNVNVDNYIQNTEEQHNEYEEHSQEYNN